MGNELELWEVQLASPCSVSVLEPAGVPKTSNIRVKVRIVIYIACMVFAAAFPFGAIAVGILRGAR